MRLRFLSLSGLLCSAPLHAVCGQTFFTIADLGSLGGRESRAYAISETGSVVGEADTAHGGVQAFLWTPAGGMVGLGSLGGASRAYSVNASNVVVGESDSTSGTRRAFIWDSLHGLRPLSVPAGTLDSSAYAVNDRQEIAGAIDEPSGSVAVVWTSPAADPRPITSTGRVGLARDIGPDGRIVGFGEIGGEDRRVTRAFAYDAGGFAHPLADLPRGLGSAAHALARNGLVAGHMETDEGLIHAFLFDTTQGLRDIDTLNNTYSSANAVNDDGQTVGVFFRGANDDDQAFLYADGSMYNLNDLLETDEDWVLLEARDVNSAGQIVGRGLLQGAERAFLLSPIPNHGRKPDLRVRLVRPAMHETFPEHTTITLEAEAHAEAGVKRVMFYAHGLLLGTATNAPFSWTWENAPAGDCDLAARVIDQRGLSSSSGRVRIHVQLPSNAVPRISYMRPIENPSAGQVFIAGQAEDTDGEVIFMNVFVDDQLIHTEEGDTISVAATNLPAGLHTITIDATDDRGAKSTSAPLSITVLPPSPP